MTQADQDLLALVAVQLQLAQAALQLIQQVDTCLASFFADDVCGQIDADPEWLTYGVSGHDVTFFQDEETPAQINAPAFCSVGLITNQVWLITVADI